MEHHTVPTPVVSETTFDLPLLTKIIKSADICPLRLALDELAQQHQLRPGDESDLTDIDEETGQFVPKDSSSSNPSTSQHRSLLNPKRPENPSQRPVSHSPSTPPRPRYVMTKAFLHRDSLGNTADSTSPHPPSARDTNSSEGRRKRKRKNQSELDVQPPTNPNLSANSTKPPRNSKNLPQRLPMVQATVAYTTAPNALPSLPLPRTASSIPTATSTDGTQVEPPAKKP